MQFYTQEDTKAFDTVRFLFIKTSLDGHIFTLTLNRPEKRNAFTPTMAAEIAFALAYAHYHAEIRCVVIEAAGPVFCAGADLNTFHEEAFDTKNVTLPTALAEIKLGDVFTALLKPVIAKVEGPVIAGAFLIICGCHFVISIPDATFSLPEVKRGVWPMQVMASLSQVVTPRKLLEMAITARSYSAAEAFEIGLVTAISTPECIDQEVASLANQISGHAPLAIQMGLRAFTQMKEVPEGQKHAFLKAQLDLLLATEDAKEGTNAFREKRNPKWKGK